MGIIIQRRRKSLASRGANKSFKGANGERRTRDAEGVEFEAPRVEKPGELSQWLVHDNSTINTVVVIIVINAKNCSLSIVLTATDQKPQCKIHYVEKWVRRE